MIFPAKAAKQSAGDLLGSGHSNACDCIFNAPPPYNVPASTEEGGERGQGDVEGIMVESLIFNLP